MEFHKTLKIEEKPGGGFIATSESGAQPIEAATKEELIQKIEMQLLQDANLSPLMVKALSKIADVVNAKVNIKATSEAKVIPLQAGQPLPPEAEKLLAESGIKPGQSGAFFSVNLTKTERAKQPSQEQPMLNPAQASQWQSPPVISSEARDTTGTILRIIAALLALGFALYMIWLRR